MARPKIIKNSTRLTVTLDEQAYAEVCRLAALQDVSAAVIFRRALQSYLGHSAEVPGALPVNDAAFPAPNASSVAERSLVVASTTSVEVSGLFSKILPKFTARTGITVNVVAQGTGKALDAARRGDADLLLVHDPEAEQQFMDESHGSTRRQVAWNDFIIVGPSADPAHVGGGSDSVAALKAIAESQARFVSRGDNSGTNAAELRLWKAAGRTPAWLNKAKWYRNIGGGMGQALSVASALDAYTVTDRGTWLSSRNKGSLIVVVEGDPRLLNRYDVIELDPRKYADARIRTAKLFADWLVSPEGQQAIGAHQAAGKKLFTPSAGSPR